MSYAQLRDPTKPADYIENVNINPNALVLNQVVISPYRRIAVISGNIVKVGDEISGMKIISIDENSVQIQGQDNIVTLYLFGAPIKHEPKL